MVPLPQSVERAMRKLEPKPNRSRNRDFQAEYIRRIEKGLKAGKSRSAARGHPTARDLPKPAATKIDRNSPMERALARMKRGESQIAAAKAEGVRLEKLRIYREQHTTSQRRRRAWIIFDLRPDDFWIASKGKLQRVTLARDDASQLSAYWRAVELFSLTNNAEHLRPFVGKGVYDVRGVFHPFETGPNNLRKLDSAGELSFLEIYADVAK
jgi:hypothetical protein